MDSFLNRKLTRPQQAQSRIKFLLLNCLPVKFFCTDFLNNTRRSAPFASFTDDSACTKQAENFLNHLFSYEYIFITLFFFTSGMFQQVGDFVVDSTGKHKLVVDDAIIWPNDASAPSSNVLKCRSCDEHCYNGRKTVVTK